MSDTYRTIVPGVWSDCFEGKENQGQGRIKNQLVTKEGTSIDDNEPLPIVPIITDEYENKHRILGDNIFKGVPLSIATEHHEIHCGDSYEATYTADMGNGVVVNFAIIVPNEGLVETNPGDDQTKKQYHFKSSIDTEFESLIEIYEGAVLSSNGTTIPIFNRNRNSTLVDFLGLYLTPIITNDGTKIFQKRIGSSRSFGGTAGREGEIILKDNTIYIIRIINGVTTNNYYNLEIDYYVHPGV